VTALTRALRVTVDWLVAAALFLMMLITFLDVVGRYLVNRPLPGAAELVQYLMLSFIFLALPLVTLQEGHISISIIESLAGARARRAHRVLVFLGSAFVVGVLCVRLWMHGEMLAANRDVIGYLNLPLAPAAFAAAVLSGLTTLVLVAMAGMELYTKRQTPG
jgi:TRAP-type transport system small permease protein